MKIFILLFLFFIQNYAVELIKYSTYDRQDRVDIMLSFNKSYNASVSKKQNKDTLLLILKNITYNKDEIKNFNSSFLENMTINSKNNNLYLMFNTKKDVNVSIVNIDNKFGVRIRIEPQYLLKNKQTSILNEIQEKDNISKFKEYDYTNYIYVMVVLIALLVILLFLKKKLNSSMDLNSDFSVIFQKQLDRNNKFMILEHGDIRYIMIIGNSNLVLKTYEAPSKDLKNNDSFDSFFEENKRKIQDLINKKQKNQ